MMTLTAQMTEPTWAFDWQGGGYNTVTAGNASQALQRAVALGLTNESRKVTLTPVPSSIRIVSDNEMADLDRHYAGMFD
jgi:acetyl-CoA acetyltransferase